MRARLLDELASSPSVSFGTNWMPWVHSLGCWKLTRSGKEDGRRKAEGGRRSGAGVLTYINVRVVSCELRISLSLDWYKLEMRRSVSVAPGRVKSSKQSGRAGRGQTRLDLTALGRAPNKPNGSRFISRIPRIPEQEALELFLTSAN